jgi:hypothetical protein
MMTASLLRPRQEVGELAGWFGDECTEQLTDLIAVSM